MNQIANGLDDSEYRAIAPVISLWQHLDMSPGWVKTDGFNILQFKHASDHCPFEVHLGQGAHRGHLNFFVGSGAELYNYEPLGDEQKQIEIADDLTRFLTSSVEAEEHLTAKGNVRTIYRIEKFLLNGEPLSLVYKNYAWPPFRYRKNVIRFSPWVAG